MDFNELFRAARVKSTLQPEPLKMQPKASKKPKNQFKTEAEKALNLFVGDMPKKLTIQATKDFQLLDQEILTFNSRVEIFAVKLSPTNPLIKSMILAYRLTAIVCPPDLKTSRPLRLVSAFIISCHRIRMSSSSLSMVRSYLLLNSVQFNFASRSKWLATLSDSLLA